MGTGNYQILNQSWHRSLTIDIHSDISLLTQHFTHTNLNEFRLSVVRWLKSPDPYTNHGAACGKRQDKTGQWIMDLKQYLFWKGDPNSFLWVHGIGEHPPVIESPVRLLKSRNSGFWEDCDMVRFIPRLV